MDAGNILSYSNKPHVTVDISKVSEKKGKVVFTLNNAKNSEQLELHIQKMRIVDPKEAQKESKLYRKVVHLNLKDRSSQVVRVNIKFSHILDFMDKKEYSKEKIKEFINSGKLVEKMMERAAFVMQKRKNEGQTDEELSSQADKTDREESSLPLDDAPEPLMSWTPTSSEGIDPKVKTKLLSTLQNDFGLTQEEFETIEKFYAAKKDDLRLLAADLCGLPMFINRNSIDPPLPRNVVFFPEGSQPGLYVLMGTKNGMKEIGVGSFNKVTLALHLDSGSKKGFRSALDRDISTDEVVLNTKLASEPQHFVAGYSVRYEGKYRARKGITGKNRESLKKFENVEKIGFIVDLIDGGELATYLKTLQDEQYKLKIACDVTEKIARLHHKKYVHLDLKPQNVLMSHEGLKLSDFGMSKPQGTRITCCGSPGYIAPELIQEALGGERCTAECSLDSWSMGCMLIEIFYGDGFLNWHLDACYDKRTWRPKKEVDPNEFELIKSSILTHRQDSNHYDYFIDQCLQIEPSNRSESFNVTKGLRELYINRYLN